MTVLQFKVLQVSQGTPQDFLPNSLPAFLTQLGDAAQIGPRWATIYIYLFIYLESVFTYNITRISNESIVK